MLSKGMWDVEEEEEEILKLPAFPSPSQIWNLIGTFGEREEGGLYKRDGEIRYRFLLEGKFRRIWTTKMKRIEFNFPGTLFWQIYSLEIKELRVFPFFASGRRNWQKSEGVQEI